MPTPTPQPKRNGSRNGSIATTKKGLAAKKKPSQGPTLPMNTPDPGSRVNGDDNQLTAED